MKLPDLIEGRFNKRISRFSAEAIIHNSLQRVYVPNSGRMRELLKEGARVFLSGNDKEERITKYDLLLVDHDGTLVSIDSRVPNLLLTDCLNNNTVDFWDDKICGFKKEAVFGDSRLDFRVNGILPSGMEKTGFVEAKSVTLVEAGTAMFPDAPTERGVRHLQELIKAVKLGYRGIVVFIIQRSDVTNFRAHREMDPDFADGLKEAYQEGVEIYAYRCRVCLEEIELDSRVPILLD